MNPSKKTSSSSSSSSNSSSSSSQVPVYRVSAGTVGNESLTTQQATIREGIVANGGAMMYWMATLAPSSTTPEAYTNPGTQRGMFKTQKLDMWCADGKTCSSPSPSGMPEQLQALLASGCFPRRIQVARDGTGYFFELNKGWYSLGSNVGSDPDHAMKIPQIRSHCSHVPDNLTTFPGF